jgi:hypothetical protein
MVSRGKFKVMGICLFKEVEIELAARSKGGPRVVQGWFKWSEGGSSGPRVVQVVQGWSYHHWQPPSTRSDSS